MQRMDRADPFVHRRTRESEDWRIGCSDDLNAESSQWRPQVAFVAYREVGHDGSVAAKPTSDTDRLIADRQVERGHTVVARIG